MPAQEDKSSTAAVDGLAADESPTSLRSWLAKLQQADQLRQIDCEVDSNLEIGAITRVNLGLAGPGLQFNNIKDYQDTISRRFVTCALGNRKQLCMLVDLPEETPDKDIVRHFKTIYQNPIEPNIVDSAAHKQNIIKGDDIDLAQFPAPIWHELDGGRYINTFCGVITQDQHTGRENVGLYRGQVVSKNRIAKVMLATQGGGGHLTGYREKREPMPIAIAYGAHDVVTLCAGSPFPRHICE